MQGTEMKISYYPGCSLEGTARDYRKSLEAVCHHLGIELQELDDWNCCGATAAHSINHHASIALPARNLAIACGRGQDMVVPCPLCFNRLKSAEKAISNDAGNTYGVNSNVKIRIFDLADFLAQDYLLDLIVKKVKKSLTGMRAVTYYGCMSSRPPRITDASHPENPLSMDRILERLGVEVKSWSYKTDCCGASHAIARRDVVFNLVGKLYEKAIQAGAECIVVSCQMCQANLDMYQDKVASQLGKPIHLPILYFTDLMALAFGLEKTRSWMAQHFVDPAPLLKKIGL
jgi:heterodisulfide reductase subunit B